MIKEVKQKMKGMRAAGFKISNKIEKAQLDSLIHAKKISKSIKELDDINEKVAIAKSVVGFLIDELGLNYNGRILMVSELLQTEIGLNIMREQAEANNANERVDETPIPTAGLSYVS